jgi:hypothetical protein
MKATSKVALLSVSSLLFVALAIPVAAADEHQRQDTQRAEAEHGRPQQRPATLARPTYDTRGQVLDSRYNHGRYYPPMGTVRPSLPQDYRSYYHGRERFYFNGGIWYAPRGPGFVVVRPPAGLVISVLPPYYSTLWFGGVPFYYANNVYYSWQPDQNGYAVVDPPDGADAPGADAPGAPPDNLQQDLIIYPKNGQSKDQQAADQYDCHAWANGQTGFDPTQPGDGSANSALNRSNYDRAMSACLQARGYQVN